MEAKKENPINMRAAGITLTLAALVIAILAVTFTAGQADATTINIAPGGDDNSIPQSDAATATPTPRPHATPEACAADGDVARVVDSGHYALFDVWWNDEEGELTNTLCPPSITYVPAKRDDFGDIITPARVDRSPSSINITAEPPTIIHIPSSAKVTLSESNYPIGKYADVWDADNAENPDGDGDRNVWVLPACPPKGPTSNGLCISYSAALLNQADWTDSIEFIVTHVHQVDIDKQDRRYVAVYDVPDTGSSGAPEARWYSRNQKVDKVYVEAGGYDRPMWFFPSRGAYEFQVYIRGNPDATGSVPISTDKSVSSDLRSYILHVGAEADLDVSMEMTPQSPSAGKNVSMEITASNSGPDTAPSTKVDVTLPEGLTHVSHSPSAFTFADGDGDGVWTWNIGGLASGASMTLTVTARVDAETHGKALTAKAVISATETVTTNSGTYNVPVPDENPDNTAEDTVTVERTANVNPNFLVVRSVAENSQGVDLGDPVPVLSGDDDTLFYSLAGVGSDKFEATGVTGGVQLSVADEAVLNYEDASSYTLILGVSDRKDDNGNANDVIDGKIAVRINITDVSNEQMIVTLSADRTTQTLGQPVILTAKVSNSPVATSQLQYSISAYNEDIPNHDEYETGVYSLTYTARYTRFPVSRTYVFSVRFDPPGPEHSDAVESNYIRVNWNR